MADTEYLINRNNSASRESEGSFDRIWRPIIAEMVGVTLFVFVGCCALVSGNITSAALGHGLTIALLIMGLGEISGGHFNPAVTLGVTLAGGLPVFLAPGYIIGQIVGGVLGAALVRGTLPSGVYSMIKGGVHHLGKYDVPDSVSTENVKPGWGLLIEMVLTTVLVFTVLMSAVNPRTKTSLAPLAIGFAVAVDIMAGGMLTGASMNPARAIGPAIVASAVLDNAWEYHYIYWIGPILGAILAALLYKLLFTSANQRWIARATTVSGLTVND
ncbi:aquaporin-8-like [Mercenaria mercenaria]|uniref:aquaporin-8-like n=1 Tax=Mercenaria mercenaria TaxID=6596 RepID=UPI00234F9ED8|nr:aquaporin-8-like [Mercenaria mercenaria]